MSEHIEKTIALAMQKLTKQEQEVVETKRLINHLREFAGQPPQYADVEGRSGVSPLNGDEYYNKKLTTACRLVLVRRKSMNLGPATHHDIFDTLLEGGYEHDAKDNAMAKKSLYNQMSQNSSIFHKLPSGKFGLAAWYPDAPKKRRKKRVRLDEVEEAIDEVEAGTGIADVAKRLLEGEGEADA